MTINKDGSNGGKASKKSGEVRQSPASAEKKPASKQPIASPTEETLLNRGKSAELREDVLLSREKTANQRDEAAQEREHRVNLRENGAREAEAEHVPREDLIRKLKKANEQLVLSSIQAQIANEEAQKAKDRLEHMAHHDFLTDLPNRARLTERLDQAVSLAKRHDSKLAVLFIDLDRFKIINDSQGHTTGDALLTAVAQRLRSVVRDADTISRQGGDEFVVVMSEVSDEGAVAAFAEKICEVVSAPYTLNDQVLKIGATIGISLYPNDGQSAEHLIRNADLAMYRGKTSTTDRYHFFSPDMNSQAIDRQMIETDLLHALERRELVLFYQPKVNLDTGMITGAEALLRWNHPQWGMLLPDRFVPIAESCGLIVPIGRWVLREACRQAVRWQDKGLKSVTVAVNISALEFRNRGFIDNLRSTLQHTGLDPHQLQLEITESVLMVNAESSLAQLNQIRRLGVELTMDDFGTGYSSLSYLNKFPIDVLKIDRSFIQGIGTTQDNSAIASAIISMGSSLNLRIIAEGVEEQAQQTYLKAQHCEEGQGYLFSRPLAAKEFTELLTTGITHSAPAISRGL